MHKTYRGLLEFSDQDDVKEVKFKTSSSNYSVPFWQAVLFPNMQKVFEGFFKNDLKEVENK